MPAHLLQRVFPISTNCHLGDWAAAPPPPPSCAFQRKSYNVMPARLPTSLFSAILPVSRCRRSHNGGQKSAAKNELWMTDLSKTLDSSATSIMTLTGAGPLGFSQAADQERGEERVPMTLWVVLKRGLLPALPRRSRADRRRRSRRRENGLFFPKGRFGPHPSTPECLRNDGKLGRRRNSLGTYLHTRPEAKDRV